MTTTAHSFNERLTRSLTVTSNNNNNNRNSASDSNIAGRQHKLSPYRQYLGKPNDDAEDLFSFIWLRLLGIKSPDGAVVGTGSLTSSSGAVLTPEEPITLYKLELERLQYIFHFPEEVAFQLSSTEYELFYSIPPLDYVHYVTCDLSSTPLHENPSNVRILVKRFAEVNLMSWSDSNSPIR